MTDLGIKERLLRRAPAFLAAALLFCAVSPLFFSLSRINGNDDFLQLAARHLVFRRAVLEEGAFPLRTPYFNGGFPSLGDPEDPSLSPFAALTLAFGEVAGLKLIALLVFAGGCAGMYLLLRRFSGLGAEASAYGMAVYGLSGWFVTRLYSGNVNELYLFLAPLLLFLFENYLASAKRPWLLAAAALLAAIAMDGKAATAALGLFLAFYAAARCLDLSGPRPAWRAGPARAFLAAAGLAVLFAAVKIIPVLELFSASGSVLRPALDSHSVGAYADVLAFGWGSFLRGMLTGGAPDRSVSLYLGFVPALLFAAGAVKLARRNYAWLAAAVFFALLWAGPNAPADLFRLLWGLPFFGTISQPHKYFDLFVVLSVCAAAASAFQAAGERLAARPGARAAALAVLAAASAVPLLMFSFPKYASMFRTEAPRPDRAGEFFQVAAPTARDGAAMYFNALQGVGTVNWYAAIVRPTPVRPRYFLKAGGKAEPNPDYRGEVYCEGGGCGPAVFAANGITAAAGANFGGRLVFNQNYDARWRSGDGLVVNHGGLLALDIEARPQRRLAALDYRPAGFYAGAAVSFISLLAAGLWGFRRRGT